MNTFLPLFLFFTTEQKVNSLASPRDFYWEHSPTFFQSLEELSKSITHCYAACPMSKDLTHILEAIGLDEQAAKLYITGLEFGAAPASEYAKKTGFNRITTYNILEELVQAGHFTMEKRMRAKWYAPVAPEFLALEARKNVEALQRSLPELRSLQGAKYRSPHVRFFEGWDGVKHVYEDTLTAKSELLNFANSAVVRKFWPNYDEEYVAERVKRGISLRGIAPDDAAGRKVHGEDRSRFRPAAS